LPDGVGDAEYLNVLEPEYATALDFFKPELVVYVAGADPYLEDKLGGLSLTFEGLKERDRQVIWHALRRGIPVAITLAGGYAEKVEDTVVIHENTLIAAKEVVENLTDPA
jgi:acetoin utilization deacetylase AcuC-like enzyme